MKDVKKILSSLLGSSMVQSCRSHGDSAGDGHCCGLRSKGTCGARLFPLAWPGYRGLRTVMRLLPVLTRLAAGHGP